MRRDGFSMVEVVVALGIISFALVSIFGLLSVGLMAGKQSDSDTMVASMTSQITGRLRSGRDSINAGATASYFFDNQGRLQTVSNDQPITAATSASLYQCQVGARIPSSEFSDIGTHLKLFTLTYSWPTAVSDPTKRPNRETLHATLSN